MPHFARYYSHSIAFHIDMMDMISKIPYNSVILTILVIFKDKNTSTWLFSLIKPTKTKKEKIVLKS